MTASVRAASAAGLRAAMDYLRVKARELLNVPAEKGSTRTGSIYYRAATPGAPPKRRTGHLRDSITVEVDESKLVGVLFATEPYGSILEDKGHPWLKVLGREHLDTARRILRETILREMRK